MLSSRKTKNSINVKASGITESVTEETQLLNDFILEMEEAKLECKLANEQLNENRKNQLQQEKEIQGMALARVRQTSRKVSPPARKRKRDDDKEQNEWVDVMRDEKRSQKKKHEEKLELQ